EVVSLQSKTAAALAARLSQRPAAVEAGLATGRPVLLVFLDRGCVERLRMIPVVDHIQKDFDSTVEVVVVDTDDKAEGFRKIYRRFSVWAGPAFGVFGLDGKPVD